MHGTYNYIPEANHGHHSQSAVDTPCHVSVRYVVTNIVLLTSRGLPSGHTADIAFICRQFPSVMFFLYDILCAMSELVLFHFRSFPRQPQRHRQTQTRVFSTKKHSVYTLNSRPCFMFSLRTLLMSHRPPPHRSPLCGAVFVCLD
jgi:hypothetical protein